MCACVCACVCVCVCVCVRMTGVEWIGEGMQGPVMIHARDEEEERRSWRGGRGE